MSVCTSGGQGGKYARQEWKILSPPPDPPSAVVQHGYHGREQCVSSRAANSRRQQCFQRLGSAPER
ncbi:hypothetical protein Bbelb_324850, partial [Branchiostoma belcheri]